MNPDNKYFVTTGLEHIRKYKSSSPIRDEQFYYVKMSSSKKYSKWLFNRQKKLWMSGYEVKIYKIKKHKIKYVINCLRTQQYTASHKDNFKWIDKPSKKKLCDEVRVYSGFLAKYFTYSSKKYEISNDDEYLAFYDKYNDKLKTSDNCINIFKAMPKHSS